MTLNYVRMYVFVADAYISSLCRIDSASRVCSFDFLASCRSSPISLFAVGQVITSVDAAKMPAKFDAIAQRLSDLPSQREGFNQDVLEIASEAIDTMFEETQNLAGDLSQSGNLLAVNDMQDQLEVFINVGYILTDKFVGKYAKQMTKLAAEIHTTSQNFFKPTS